MLKTEVETMLTVILSFQNYFKKLTAFGEPFPWRRFVQRARLARQVVADDVLVMFRGAFNTTSAVPLLTLHTQRNWEGSK